MRIRATSDLHLSEHTAEWGFAALEALRADAEEHSGITVICGDVFDQARTVHMATWNRLRDMLSSWGGHVFLIPGNHDQYAGTRNVLEGLASPRVTVVSTPQLTLVGPMLPYLPPDAFLEACGDLMRRRGDRDGRCTLWAHQGFQGAYMNGMRRDTTGVDVGALPDDQALVITGHYHMPHNVGPVIYCGSPWQTTFAEEGQDKGWLLWEEEDVSLPKRIAFGDLGAPRHHTVLWDPAEGPPVRPEGLRESDRVRVRTRAVRAEVMASMGQLKQVGLDAAPVLMAASAGRAANVGGETPQERAQAYVEAHYADAADMAMFAAREALWAD